MRILIDMQACQTSGSRRRGIGRYSTELTKAILRNSGPHEVRLILSARFPETIAEVRKTFDGLLLAENIKVLHTPNRVAHLSPASAWRRRAATLIRGHFADELGADIVHTSSLFEGLGDDAVTGSEKHRHLTSATLYDLIPMVFPNVYLNEPPTRAWYMEKIEELKRSDLLLAISEHSRLSAIDHLGLSGKRVVNISGAADSRFIPREISNDAETAIRKRFGLIRPYIMYTGGIDFRKNIDGLIDAYAQLSAALRAKFQLAIVCSVQPEERAKIFRRAAKCGLRDDELMMTGFVSDDDLADLYNLCYAFVFPSLYEGFGLPALEAMACGAAVIGSNTSSIPEVIGRHDALFDPSRSAAIAEALERLLGDETFRLELRDYGKQRAREFTWDRSGKRAIEAFEELLERQRSATKEKPRTNSKRRKLAYVSPFPPEKSGIATYAAELIPELSLYYDVILIARDKAVADQPFVGKCEIRSLSWFEENGNQLDRILYHVGNSAFHRHMPELLKRFPGVVVLHDFFLSGLVHWLDTTGVAPGLFRRSLYQAHGYPALVFYQAAGAEAAAWKYPTNFAVVSHALGVIVHSQFALDDARRWYAPEITKNWQRIPHLRTLPYTVEARHELDFSNEDFVICSFGIVDPMKVNNRLLDAFLASCLAQDRKSHLVFVGEVLSPDFQQSLESRIFESSARDRISITGFVDGETYRKYLRRADLAVQLRHRSRGETSGAVLDVLANGIPLIVNNSGAMGELPQECAVILPENFEDTVLVEALERLRSSEHLRRNMGEAARNYIQKNHDPATVAHQYYECIEEFYTSGVQARYLQTISNIADIAEPIKQPSDYELAEVASCLAANVAHWPQKQILVEVPGPSKDTSADAFAKLDSRLRECLRSDQGKGLRVEPVYWDGEYFRYSIGLTLKNLELQSLGMGEEILDVAPGDCLILGADSDDGARNAALLLLRLSGIKIYTSQDEFFGMYGSSSASHGRAF